MFISPAYAQSAAGGGGDVFGILVPLLLIMPIWYFLLIRPQQKQRKAHLEKITNIRRGDQIVTGGGIVGKVTKVVEGDVEVEMEVADGSKMRVVRAMIADVRSKGEPVKDKK